MVDQYRPRVDPRPVRQTQSRSFATPASEGAAVGQGLQDLGRGIGAVGQAFQYKAMIEEDAKAREALEQYRGAQRDVLHDPAGGYLNQTGGNAIGGRDRVDQTLNAEAERAGKGLTGRARDIYDKNVQRLQEQAADQAIRHESSESRNYVVNQHQSTVAGLLEDAAVNWQDERVFEGNLSAAITEQRKLGALQGWDAETLQNANGQLVSDAVRLRAIQIADNDPASLDAFLGANAERLTAEHQFELQQALKPVLLEHRANEFLKEHVQLPQGGQRGDPYLDRMVRAESGGRADARNPRSSAGGLHQFIRSTFREEARKMQERGLAPWAEGLSDAELEELRFDPQRSTEVHEFFRAGNQAQLRAAGHAVTLGNEYIMHHFGDGNGLRLLNTATADPGAPLSSAIADLPAVAAANSWINPGWTVGQLVDATASKMGVDAGQLTSSSYFDAGRAYAAAMAIEDPELQRTVVQRIEQLEALQLKQRAGAREQASQTAWDLYQTEGVTQLPYTLRRDMGEAGYASWQTAVRNDMIGLDYTDPDTHETLTRMASQAPQQFAELDLTQHYGHLSQNDRRAFVGMQEAARAAVAGEIAKGPYGSIDFAQATADTRDIYEAFVDEDVDKDQEARQQFIEYQSRLRDTLIRFHEQNQRAPNRQETRDLASTLVMPGQFVRPEAGFLSRAFGTDDRAGFMFETGSRRDGEVFEPEVEYQSIPIEERAAVVQLLMQASGGAVPSEAEVVEYYENQRLRGVGAPPAVVDVDEVPSWLVEYERSENPGITDAELIELYRAYLTRR